MRPRQTNNPNQALLTLSSQHTSTNNNQTISKHSLLLHRYCITHPYCCLDKPLISITHVISTTLPRSSASASAHLPHHVPILPLHTLNIYTTSLGCTYNPCSFALIRYMPFDIRPYNNPTRRKRRTHSYRPSVIHKRRTIFDQGHNPRTHSYSGRPLTSNERLHVARQRLRKFEKTQSRKAQRKTWARNRTSSSSSKLDRLHFKLKRILTGKF